MFAETGSDARERALAIASPATGFAQSSAQKLRLRPVLHIRALHNVVLVTEAQTMAAGEIELDLIQSLSSQSSLKYWHTK